MVSAIFAPMKYAPRKPSFGQVLVVPTSCGICGSGLHEYDHGPTWTSASPNPYVSASLPQIIGHEFAGHVISVGEGVGTVVRGDRVFIRPPTGPQNHYFGHRTFECCESKNSSGLEIPVAMPQ